MSSSFNLNTYFTVSCNSRFQTEGHCGYMTYSFSMYVSIHQFLSAPPPPTLQPPPLSQSFIQCSDPDVGTVAQTFQHTPLISLENMASSSMSEEARVRYAEDKALGYSLIMIGQSPEERWPTSCLCLCNKIKYLAEMLKLFPH